MQRVVDSDLDVVVCAVVVVVAIFVAIAAVDYGDPLMCPLNQLVQAISYKNLHFRTFQEEEQSTDYSQQPHSFVRQQPTTTTNDSTRY